MNLTLSRRVVLGVGALSVAFVGAAGIASSALFTSTDTSTGNAFTAGTVDLGAGNGAAAFTVTGMAPGDVDYGTVTVANNGSLELRYAMTSSSSNADSKGLASTLNAVVVPIAANATCNSASVNAGTAIYTGALNAAAFGSTATGQQTGDRTLAAAGSDKLCIQVTFPSATGNALQASTTSTTLTFAGEQTANNA